MSSDTLVGLAAVISAIFAGIATVIAAWNQRTIRDVSAKVDTNGDPRTLGQIATDVGKEIAPHGGTTARQHVEPGAKE